MSSIFEDEASSKRGKRVPVVLEDTLNFKRDRIMAILNRMSSIDKKQQLSDRNLSLDHKGKQFLLSIG
jgi:hypothetical protein